MTTPPPEPQDQLPSLPPPGWFPDPDRPGFERYWNGWDLTQLSRERVTHSVESPQAQWSQTPVARPPAVRRSIVVLAVVTAMAVGAAAYADVLPSWSQRPVPVALEAPVAPDSGYPVFGSNEAVTYLAQSMVLQREAIDVSAFFSPGVDVMDAVDDAMGEVVTQNPYVFVSGWRIRVQGAQVTVRPDYLYSNEEAEQRRVATAGAVKNILATSAVTASSGPQDIAAAMHDAVLHAATYDREAATAINNGEDLVTSTVVARSQEAYGIFVDGTAVCTGYSQAFQLLASEAGLTSVIVTGEANGGVTTGPHAWNRVLIDGQWLVVDTTWDDAADALPRRDYLLMDPRDPRLESRTTNLYWVVDSQAGAYGY